MSGGYGSLSGSKGKVENVVKVENPLSVEDLAKLPVSEPQGNAENRRIREEELQ